MTCHTDHPEAEKAYLHFVEHIEPEMKPRQFALEQAYLAQPLRAELQPDGIDVLIVSPSTTDTEFFDAAMGDKQQLKWLAKGQSPEAVARAAVRAMERGKHEIILTPGGKAMVWFDRLFPTLTDDLVRRYA